MADDLHNYRPEKPLLVAVDSDGCAMDSMELKQKRCFIPATIEVWGLQPLAQVARETAEFVNLYSRWRGTNRFVALAKTFELLARREETTGTSAELPDAGPLRRWLAREPAPSNRTLRQALTQQPDDVLQQTLEWSCEINRRVESLADDIKPFPRVGRCLEHLAQRADVVVVSATPHEAVEREWRRCGLAPYVRMLLGQEAGSKSQVLAQLAARYANGHLLMVGDAPADLTAAHANRFAFFPICPAAEAVSWQRLEQDAIARLEQGTFAGEHEQTLIREFLRSLPQTPPWE